MDIQINISTAFYTQTNRKTEMVNQVLENYPMAYVNAKQDIWIDYIPLAQFKLLALTTLD